MGGQPYACDMAKRPISADEAKRLAIKSISDWRERMLATIKLEGRALTSRSWALAAGVDPTTITRNMQPESATSSKIENLHRLAVAIGQPSVIDFLNGEATQPAREVEVVSESDLSSILAAVMEELPPGSAFADYPRAVASAVHERLTLLASAGGSAGSSGVETAPDKDAPPPVPTMKSAAE